MKSCVFLAPNPTPTCDSHLINLFGLGWNCFHLDFPGGSDGKVSAYNAGDPGSIPGSGISPGEGNGNPLQSHGWRSLVGYCPWGHKESDMTERLPFTLRDDRV